MNKLCQMLGFAALSWAVSMPTSEAFHDRQSGWMDLHGTCQRPATIKAEDTWIVRDFGQSASLWGRNFSRFYSTICNSAEGNLSDLHLSGSRRGIFINIYNGLIDRRLVNSDFYLFSGYINDNDEEILPQSSGSGIFTSSIQALATTGTVGVLSYQIEGLNDRLAIMWSVPYDRNLYSNWFNIKIIDNNGMSTDYDLYYSMYYYDDPKQGTDDAPYPWFSQRGYCIRGTMGRYSYPVLDLWINRC